MDTNRSSPARLWDAALGGKDHFDADRKLLNELLTSVPDLMTTAEELRQWLLRVGRYLVDRAGTDQFLDCGFGLPRQERLHETLQRINPDTNVIYVDKDPTVVAYGKAMLVDNDRTFCIAVDPGKPDELMANDIIRKNLDLDRPIALMLTNIVHLIEDDNQASDLMAAYVQALPSGSFVALSHLYDPADGSRHAAIARTLEEKIRQGLGSCKFRPLEQISSYFDGLDLVQPGLVKLFEWWPYGPRLIEAVDMDKLMLCGLGRKR
ncbi:SAM-dependent methyltransferase [Fodinicola feengrottensis]|uniref:SAM-dependent methyltransferase n=1 Tax=Fodinicola feengrottensis TaxID=435914 RepID=A0ABN2G2W5_9ACTN